MRDLMGVYLGNMVKGNEQVFLCFDWECSNSDEGMRRMKARYGNRKFFSTLFKTKDADSIILLHWKNDADGHRYEIRKPEINCSDDLIRLDLTKELVAMGLELKEDINQKTQRGGGSSHFYAESMWIYVGKEGYYHAEHAGGEDSRDYLNFCFAYPGIKIGNSMITKIEIDTFDSISDENTKPLYDFMRTVMDEPAAVSKYAEGELAELFTKHFPKSMHMDIWCGDKLLRASIDHLGRPQRWFSKQAIVNGKRDCNADVIETENPLELVVKELGL